MREKASMTIEQIKQALHDIDLIMRPKALFIHPKDYRKAIEAIPDLEQRVEIIKTEYVGLGGAILIDRKVLEF